MANYTNLTIFCIVYYTNSLQNYYKYLKYTRILARKCKFIYILCYKALLLAQLCDCTFGGFLVQNE